MASSSDEEQQSITKSLLTISDSDSDGQIHYEPAPKKAKNSTTNASLIAGPSRQAAAGVGKRKPEANEYTKLRALTVDQLVDLIESVIVKRPEIKSDFMQLTPSPDLTPLENRLEILSKNIARAFPNTRYGSDRDAFCYRRVKGHVIAFQKECLQHCKSLVDCQQWSSAIDYVVMAWNYANDLPKWDDKKNNKHQATCFKRFTSTLVNSLKKGKFRKQELQAYAPIFKKLAEKSHKDNGMQNCIQLLESISKKINIKMS